MIVRHLLILYQRGLHWNAKKVTIEYRSEKVDFIVACTCYNIYHIFPVHNFCRVFKRLLSTLFAYSFVQIALSCRPF